MHNEMHRDAKCQGQPEAPNVLDKNWEEYVKRVKPILKVLQEDFKRDIKEGILLEGLRDLINSNT